MDTVNRRPLRLTPPQIRVLQLLQDGWQCKSAGVIRPRIGKLVWYALWRDGKSELVAGSTLAILEERGLIDWEQTDVTLAYDGTTVPGYALRVRSKADDK